MRTDKLNRRHFIGGVTSLALLPAALTTPSVKASSLQTSTGLSSELQHRLTQLRESYRRFKVADNGEIDGANAYTAWIKRYDELVNLGDALREAITDDTTGKDMGLFEAALWMPPPCERARGFWAPIEGLSPDFRTLAPPFFEALAENACAHAECVRGRPDREMEINRAVIKAMEALQEPIPQTPGDRLVIRRVLERLNNNDMADVLMARVALPDRRLPAFRSWARTCGGYTCERCEQLLDSSNISQA
jgi:hypothetical protein